MTKSGKHCGKRRKCTFCAISSFVTMFSKSCLQQRRQKVFIWGKGLNLIYLTVSGTQNQMVIRNLEFQVIVRVVREPIDNFFKCFCISNLSNFFFCHNVFKSCLLQMCQNGSESWKGLIIHCQICLFGVCFLYFKSI